MYKRDDVGDKSILIIWLDSVPENLIRRPFSRETPAAQRQNLLGPKNLFEKLPLDVNMADVYGIARGDMTECQMDMRIRFQIHGRNLHVQAWTVQIIGFKVAYAHGLSWS